MTVEILDLKLNKTKWKQVASQWQAFWKSPSGKMFGNVLSTLFIVGMLAYLSFQLYQIGFVKIITSLPTNPLFYFLFFLIYLALPTSEQFIYGLSLKFPFWDGMKASLEKRILNGEISYSGEAYYYMWAKKNLDESPKKIFNVIKDNNIISAFASTLTAIFVLAVCSYLGDKSFLEVFNFGLSKNNLILLALVILVVIILGWSYRKYIISMSGATALKIFLIHALRIICVNCIEILMWTVAVPDIPIEVWFIFFAAKIIVSRIPFINQDLLFVSITMGLSQEMNIMDRPDVAAVLITSTVLAKITGIVLFTLLLSSRKKQIEEDIRRSEELETEK